MTGLAGIPRPLPDDAPRPQPRLEGSVGEFYGWIARGELRFQRCGACGTWRHLPRPICAACHGPDWSWERSSGRGEVYTWTVTHRSLHPAFTGVPYAQVLVEMDKGPRVLSWVVDVPPDELEFGCGSTSGSSTSRGRRSRSSRVGMVRVASKRLFRQ